MSSVVSYIKVIAVKYDTVNYPLDTTSQLVRTYTDAVTSADSIAVYFNGQMIPEITTQTPSTFSKFYYSATIVTGTTPSVTFTITANQDFLNPDYNSATPATLGFTSKDVIYIEYTYQVTI